MSKKTSWWKESYESSPHEFNTVVFIVIIIIICFSQHAQERLKNTAGENLHNINEDSFQREPLLLNEGWTPDSYHSAFSPAWLPLYLWESGSSSSFWQFNHLLDLISAMHKNQLRPFSHAIWKPALLTVYLYKNSICGETSIPVKSLMMETYLWLLRVP